MTIGLVIPATPRYSETFFYQLIQGLQDKGNKVVLFVQSKQSDFKVCPAYTRPRVINNKVLQALNVFWIMLSLLPYVGNVYRYYKALKTQNIPSVEVLKRLYLNSHILKRQLDWLHFGFATQAIGSEMVAKAIKAKMAVSFRGFDINVYPKKHKNCYKILWKHVDKIHSISNYLVEQAYTLGLDKSAPVSVITPAINFEILPKTYRIEQSDNLTITTVARLNWIKDLTTALYTIKILNERFPKLMYNIVGNGSLIERERYLFLVHQLGLKDCVRFHYQLKHEDALQLVQQSDIYLQTSLNEGFCNAVLEAQALGTLSVATDVGGIKENISNGQSGWLVNTQDPTGIAEKIIAIYNLPRDMKLGVREFAKKRVKSRFNLDNQSTKFDEFYRQ